MQEDITKLSRTAYLFTSIAFVSSTFVAPIECKLTQDAKFFLGLNLVVAIFGMNMIPEDTHPAWPAVSLVLVALIFFSLTIDPRPLNLMLPP
jgi:Mg2+ and Co2+ transporter CorA